MQDHCTHSHANNLATGNQQKLTMVEISNEAVQLGGGVRNNIFGEFFFCNIL